MVNSALMKRYQGKRVTAVLKVLQMGQGQALCQTADGGQVSVKLQPGSVFSGAFVEVTGIVEEDAVLREERFTPISDNFDMNTYNQLCKLAQEQAIF